MKKKSKIKMSVTYAKAWYDGVIEKKELDIAFADAEKLESSIIPEDIKDLSSPILENSIKKEIIDEVSKKLKLSSSTLSFLSVLIENNRFEYLASILASFKSLYYKYNDIVEVSIQSVKPLSVSQDAELKKNLEKFLSKKIKVNYGIRPDILGGLVIMYGSYQIDDSIKGKLIHLESVMKGVG